MSTSGGLGGETSGSKSGNIIQSDDIIMSHILYEHSKDAHLLKVLNGNDLDMVVAGACQLQGLSSTTKALQDHLLTIHGLNHLLALEKNQC